MKNIFIFSTLFLFFNIANAQVQIGADIDGETQDDYSGSSVSVSSDGQFLAIGAPQNDVRVFQKVGSSWVQQGADIDGPSPGDWAGTVAISDDGTRVVIGAKYINANGGASGHARIYSYDGTVWTQLGSDINGEAAFDYAGHAVSMSADGNTIAIGATHNDGNGVTDGGHTRVYSFTGGSWVQKGGDIDGESTQDNSGWSVSLTADGNTVAIGAYKNNANGTEVQAIDLDGMLPSLLMAIQLWQEEHTILML